MSRFKIKPVGNIILVDHSGPHKKNVRRKVSLPVRIAQIEVFCPFFVVQGLNQNLLFGRDMMTELNVQLEFNKVKVTFEHEGKVASLPMCEGNQVGYVVASINPRVNKLLDAKVTKIPWTMFSEIGAGIWPRSTKHPLLKATKRQNVNCHWSDCTLEYLQMNRTPGNLKCLCVAHVPRCWGNQEKESC